MRITTYNKLPDRNVLKVVHDIFQCDGQELENHTCNILIVAARLLNTRVSCPTEIVCKVFEFMHLCISADTSNLDCMFHQNIGKNSHSIKTLMHKSLSLKLNLF